METLFTLFFRLAGADYNVIKSCTSNTIAKYACLAFSLMLGGVLAFVGGGDVAHQFTPVIPICVAVAMLWSTAVFSFDFFLINAGKVSGFFRIIRIPVAFANIFITASAIMVMLNQASIDNTISLQNSSAIAKLDSIYLTAKEARYSEYNKRKTRIDEYHQKSCVPEAMNVRPGPLYDMKHALCVKTNAELATELGKLDSVETSYYNPYQQSRQALVDVKSNDFFLKAKLLTPIFKANKFAAILAFCFFVFASYIELQALVLKFSIDEKDEYHLALARYNEGHKEILNSEIEGEVVKKKRERGLKQREQSTEYKVKFLETDVAELQYTILREYRFKGMQKVLKAKGYTESADTIQKFIDRKEVADKIEPLTNLFVMTNPMITLLNSIRAKSESTALAENIFNWMLENIQYDTEHTKEYYRNAAQTYNNRKGICGELSILLMAFYRCAGIPCQFVRVDKDNTGKEISHACVGLKNDFGELQLVDVTYKNFNVKHLAYAVLTDEELINSHKTWNQ